MIGLVLAIIASLACGYAIYTDLKYRYVNDWLSWGLVGFGLASHLIISLATWSYEPILFSAAGAAAFYVIGLGLFYMGAFGGGDIKLLVGVAATVPIYPAVINQYAAPVLARWPFLLSLGINILLVGALYSLLYMVGKALANWKKFKKRFLAYSKKLKKLYLLGVIVLILPLAGLLHSPELAIMLSMLAVLTWFTLLFFPFARAAEDVMIYSAKPSELEAGDRPVSEVKVGKKVIYKPKRIGLEEDDVKKLQALEKLGKIKKLKVKDGVPYAPAILLGLLASLLVGDLLLALLSSLV